MNVAIKTGLFAAGALLAYNAFAKGNALQSLNFYPKKVYDIKMDGVTPVLKIGLAIQNTSNQFLMLHSLAGNVYCNDFLIGNVSAYTPTRIGANGETILILSIRLSLIGIVQDIIRAFNGGGWKQKINLDARANIDRYQIPVKVSYQIG